jgi:FkbM family methyltransferase
MGRPATSLEIATRIVRRVWNHPANVDTRVASVLRALAWQAYKRGVRRPVDVAFPGGFVVRCHPDSNSASSVVYFNRLFDWEEMLFCWRFLRPGDRVLDVGGNIGVYTALMAFLVGESGHVDVFEPFPPHATRIRENVALNRFEQRVSVHEVALSDSDGETLFVVDRDVSNRVPTRTDGNAAKIQVPLRRLDSVISQHEPVVFAKLDVEGLEEAVINGSAGLGAALPLVWVFETNDGLLRKRDSSLDRVTAAFHRLGYEIWDFDVTRGALCAVQGPAKANLFAVRRDAVDDVKARLAAGTSPPPAPWFG